MRKTTTLLLYFCLLLAATSSCCSADDLALSASALIGRWGNSGVRYGFSDDGYFYKSTVLSRTNTRSIYHSSTTRYSGDYVYYTPGWTEYQFYPTYTYLNTLFGRYIVKGGIIRFDSVISIPHSTFPPKWYRRETRGTDDEEFTEMFQRGEFVNDFTEEFEFITSTRLRLRDKTTDKDFFWDFAEDPHNVPIPTHVIPPVVWPSEHFSPEMPRIITKGRLREFILPQSDKIKKDEDNTVKLIIDKTDALADIRSYVNTLRGASWWSAEPKNDATSMNLEARKGMWEADKKY